MKLDYDSLRARKARLSRVFRSNFSRILILVFSLLLINFGLILLITLKSSFGWIYIGFSFPILMVSYWNRHELFPLPPEKPENFELMKHLAEKISKGLPQARIDFYEVNGKVYFGEITLFHFSGMTPFHPRSVDREWGNWIKLPSNKPE